VACFTNHANYNCTASVGFLPHTALASFQATRMNSPTGKF